MSCAGQQVEDALARFVAPEHLDGDNSYRCGCEPRRHALFDTADGALTRARCPRVQRVRRARGRGEINCAARGACVPSVTLIVVPRGHVEWCARAAMTGAVRPHAPASAIRVRHADHVARESAARQRGGRSWGAQAMVHARAHARAAVDSRR